MAGNPGGRQGGNSGRPLLIIVDVEQMGYDVSTIQRGAAHLLSEQYAVVRTFGMIGEGFNLPEGTAGDEAASLQRRYQRRRNLAQLSRFPEGFEFMHRVQGRADVAVVLLSPPDRVAVWRSDGTWRRRARDESRDGPAPYTQEFYREYREYYGLPTWFMRPEALLCRTDSTEARLVGLPSNRATEWTHRRQFESDMLNRHYLDTRYMEVQRMPTPDPNGRGVTHMIPLIESELGRLARRFPAVIVHQAMRGRTPIYVTVDGYVTLRDVPLGRNGLVGQEYIFPGRNVVWNTENHDVPASLRASYVWEGRYTEYTADGHNAARHRSDQFAAAHAAGAMTDLRGMPLGNGTWGWLLPRLDSMWATRMGLPTPIDVAAFIGAGGLTHTTVEGEWPITTFTPQAGRIDPLQQPTNRGHWAYFMPSDREEAYTIFAGTSAVEYATEPTAAQIWRVRQSIHVYIAQGNLIQDSTTSIRLIWIEDEDDDEDGDEDEPMQDDPSPDNDNQQEEDDEDDESEQPSSNPDGIDPNTGLTHQPRNRGENNQTGTFGSRRYQSRNIGGKRYTVDRSRAHAHNEQEHKSWICTKTGTWKQYKFYDDVDWTDAESVENLNRWREQTYKRHDWPDKRPVTRVDYSPEERKFLFGEVKKANGGRPSQGMAQLTRDFQARFPREPRTETAIQAVVDRLIKEYKKHGGNQKPAVQRGKVHRKSSTQINIKAEDSDDSEADEPEEFDDDE